MSMLIRFLSNMQMTLKFLIKKYREELLKADGTGDKLNIEKWYQTEKQRIIDQGAYDMQS